MRQFLSGFLPTVGQVSCAAQLVLSDNGFHDCLFSDFVGMLRARYCGLLTRTWLSPSCWQPTIPSSVVIIGAARRRSVVVNGDFAKHGVIRWQSTGSELLEQTQEGESASMTTGRSTFDLLNSLKP